VLSYLGASALTFIDETPATTSLISEINFNGAGTLEPGFKYDIGKPFAVLPPPSQAAAEWHGLDGAGGVMDIVFAGGGGLAGDANGDGKVDLADFGILKANFGAGSTKAQGDFNGDAKVDLTDFGILQDNFGKSGQAAVPEPSTFALLTVGALVSGIRRSRVRGREQRSPLPAQ
jgi:hypothetical protein